VQLNAIDIVYIMDVSDSAKKEELEQVKALCKSSEELVRFLQEADEQFAAMNDIAQFNATTMQKWQRTFPLISSNETQVRITKHPLEN